MNFVSIRNYDWHKTHSYGRQCCRRFNRRRLISLVLGVNKLFLVVTRRHNYNNRKIVLFTASLLWCLLQIYVQLFIYSFFWCRKKTNLTKIISTLSITILGPSLFTSPTLLFFNIRRKSAEELTHIRAARWLSVAGAANAREMEYKIDWQRKWWLKCTRNGIAGPLPEWG